MIYQMLILASASPRRAELLRAAGFEFEVQPPNVDESPQAGESPDACVRRISESKARAMLGGAGDRVVLAADTVVLVDDRILGKPVDADEAAAMLRLLSGRAHEVMTGVTVARQLRTLNAQLPPKLITRVEVTTVEFAALTDEEIRWYVASGEPRDKAGAYAVQGLASRFVTRIVGSYSNVVGLPIALVHSMLRKPGASQP